MGVFQTMDTALRFRTTPRIQQALEAAQTSPKLASVDPSGALAALGPEPETIALQELQLLHKCASDGEWLHELVHGSEMVPPRAPEPVKDPQVEAQRAKMRAQFEEMQYQKM